MCLFSKLSVTKKHVKILHWLIYRKEIVIFQLGTISKT